MFEASNDGGKQLEVAFEYADVLWPWSGHLALAISVRPEAADYDGIATGFIRFAVTSPPPLGERTARRSEVEVPLRVRIVPTPARYVESSWYTRAIACITLDNPLLCF